MRGNQFFKDKNNVSFAPIRDQNQNQASIPKWQEKSLLTLCRILIKVMTTKASEKQ